MRAPSEFIPLTKEATVSAVTICGGSLFQTSITRIAKIIVHEYLPLNQDNIASESAR